MREIPAEVVSKTVEELFLKANTVIGEDVKSAVCSAAKTDLFPPAHEALDQILMNYSIAQEERVAICQDTGMSVVFLDIGQEVHITGGDLLAAIDEGVASAYRKGYFRNSVVSDPLFDRKNTLDNTPAIVHTRIVPGDRLSITVSPKGFGSENMSRIGMLPPSEGVSGVVRFVVDTVVSAGPNPCPPVIVGVGVGGTFEAAALLAKKMTIRPLDEPNADARYAALEMEILDKINASGIGPAGTGGATTALAVNINYLPTHIAGLPVAVNICCHCARHAKSEI